jgi:hypothetical protein
MLENNRYSSTVRGWLVADGHRLALAQVGPDHCILRRSVYVPPTEAERIIEVDGQRQQSRVFLQDGISETSTLVRFSGR